MNWDNLAEEASISKTVEALKKNGVEAMVVENGVEAKKKVFEMLPEGAEVMNMSSVTLDTIGVSEEIISNEKYKAVKNELSKMDRNTHGMEMQKLGSAPEWSVGSVHAVTEDGKVIIASNTGSQLPAYAYGSAHVILVIGSQKIVKNMDDAMKRIYDYVLPLESVRLNKAYNISSGSYVSKVLIINREINPERVKVIFVKEKLGF